MSLDQHPASIRPYEEILRTQIEEGEKQLERKGQGLFFSSLSAGLDIGFGPLLMATVLTFASGIYSQASTDLLLAALYPVGFILVVISRTDLYTELDARAVFPVLDNLSSLSSLGRLWAFVILGNLIGGFLFSAMAVYVGTQYGVIEPNAIAELATVYTERTTWQLFIGAIFAGWLMGLVAWLIIAARTTISAVFFVWLCTFTIALLHLPHSIAGNVEVAMGLLVDPAVSILDYGRFLLASLIGNAVGGVIFAAILKFAGRPSDANLP
ncbi:MAG TPA: formate/nitrite transporter family protein [Balneolaceae bacterium]